MGTVSPEQLGVHRTGDWCPQYLCRHPRATDSSWNCRCPAPLNISRLVRQYSGLAVKQLRLVHGSQDRANGLQ